MRRGEKLHHNRRDFRSSWQLLGERACSDQAEKRHCEGSVRYETELTDKVGLSTQVMSVMPCPWHTTASSRKIAQNFAAAQEHISELACANFATKIMYHCKVWYLADFSLSII